MKECNWICKRIVVIQLKLAKQYQNFLITIILPPHMKLNAEICLTLAFKLTAMAVIWWLCFSHPIAPELKTSQMQQHFLGTSETSHADHNRTR